MLTRTALLILLLLPVPLAVAQEGEPFTIAAYNVENMFDVFDNPYTRDETTAVKPRDEIEAIAQAILAMDADVVAFSEIENEQVLRAMVRELLPGGGYEYVAAVPSNDSRGITLGVISRRPITRVASYRFQTLSLPDGDRTWRFARGLAHVTIQATPEKPLELFVVHFKSKLDSRDDPESANWRLAEAVAADQIIDGLLNAEPDAWVAMVGDFNDTPGTPPLARLLADDELIDVHASLPADERITYLHEPYRSTIDYILVSPALADRVITDSPRVLDDPALLRGSDHAPLLATFDLAEGK